MVLLLLSKLFFLSEMMSSDRLVGTMYLYVQVQEVRLRLNVDATVPPGSQPAPAPIESFTDMVRISRCSQ